MCLLLRSGVGVGDPIWVGRCLPAQLCAGFPGSAGESPAMGPGALPHLPSSAVGLCLLVLPSSLVIVADFAIQMFYQYLTVIV